MLKNRSKVSTRLGICIFLFLSTSLCIANEDITQAVSGKELWLPDNIGRVPEGNDFNDENSEYCYKHMVESDNVALFWHKEYGDDPMANPDVKRRFDPKDAVNECERFYDYYVNNLKMLQKENKYKLLVIVFGGNEGTAFGGGLEDKIGALWTPAVRINRKPYGALAHEMGHSFQYLSRAECGQGPSGPIIEMSAQYMLWQVYPEWMTFENYHLVDFMKQTHLSFLNPANMYHSPYVLEYWSNKHGIEFFGKLSRESQRGEDPVMTYKRLNSLSQQQYNDEMFDACRRFITWDMARIEKPAHKYANQHKCKLTGIEDNWYKIPVDYCPQNYGYNGIKMNVPAAGSKIELEFTGIAGEEGYSNAKTELAGWRYGFVASLADGSRVYSDMYNKSEGKAEFTVPDKTEYLWLVVMGAPTEHSQEASGWGRPRNNSGQQQWPYKVKLTGTTFDNSVVSNG